MPRGTPKECKSVCLIGDIEIRCELKPGHRGNHLNNVTDTEEDYTQYITIVWAMDYA